MYLRKRIRFAYGLCRGAKGKLYFWAQKSPIEGAKKWGLDRLLLTASLPLGNGQTAIIGGVDYDHVIPFAKPCAKRGHVQDMDSVMEDISGVRLPADALVALKFIPLPLKLMYAVEEDNVGLG